MQNTKKILIISGTHGNELSAVEAGLYLKKHYANNKNIKVIPFLNQSGLEANTREVQKLHTKDLNRSFTEETTYNECIKTIEEEVQYHDVVIDIHNSHRCANFCLVDKGFNCGTISSICHESGVEYATRFSKGGTIKDYVNQYGKIGITYEFSGMQTLHNEKELDQAIYDVRALVAYFVNGKDDQCSCPDNELKSMHCLETGFINFKQDINQIVFPGEEVFEVINELGDVVETVRNTESQKIKLMALSPSFQTRGSLVLQYIIKE